MESLNNSNFFLNETSLNDNLTKKEENINDGTMRPLRDKLFTKEKLEDLKQVNSVWMSDLEIWKVEIQFFNRLITKIELKKIKKKHKERLEDFHQIGLSFQFETEELIALLNLDGHFNSELVQDGQEEDFSEVYQNGLMQMENFNQRFKDYKKQLYSFVERYI